MGHFFTFCLFTNNAPCDYVLFLLVIKNLRKASISDWRWGAKTNPWISNIERPNLFFCHGIYQLLEFWESVVKFNVDYIDWGFVFINWKGLTKRIKLFCTSNIKRHISWLASLPSYLIIIRSGKLECTRIDKQTNDNFYILCNYIEKNLKEKIKKVIKIQYFSATEIEFRLCFFRFKSYKMKDSM